MILSESINRFQAEWQLPYKNLAKKQMKASDLFVKALESQGVKFVFGIPGEENLDLLESLRKSSIKLILTRHEQAAGFMAANCGRLTGQPGVVVSTLGPGATNLVTAAAYAQLGGMPLVLITAQKSIKRSRQGEFQLVNAVEMFRPITKSARQIVDPSRIPFCVREAFRLAMLERPGAVHLELPEDIAREQIDDSIGEIARTNPRRPVADHATVMAAVKMIEEAKSPLLFTGAGANRKRTSAALRAFVKKTGIPYFSTQMGLGVLDSSGEFSLGAAALSSNELLHEAIDKADLIISVGHDPVEKPPFLNSGAKVIHVNFFSAQVDAVYLPHYEIVGDIATSMGELTRHITRQEGWDFSFFMQTKQRLDRLRVELSNKDNFPLCPQRVAAEVRAAMPDDGIVCLDNGLYKLSFVDYYPVHMPNTLLLDNALATMGAGLPSAMAARLVFPDKKVMAVCGDGGFMMNSQELETAVRLGMNLVVLILSDSGYGMIKWKQRGMNLPVWGLDFGNPDFVKYAEAYGAHGHRVGSAEQLLPVLRYCLEQPGVHLIEVPIDYEQNHLLAEPVAPITQKKEAKKMRTTLEVISPFDQAIVGRLDMANENDIETALAKARALFDNQDGWLPRYKRIAVLERLAELMKLHKDHLIQTAISEGGKPYVDTVVEVERAIEGVKLGIQVIRQMRGEQVPMGLTPSSNQHLAMTFREPIGVVVSLSAFNHPLNLTVHQVVPAIAAGCPVIMKPATNTPLSALEFNKLVIEAGLPKDWFQMVVCDRSLAEKLATDERVGYVSFIGSAEVGWHLRSKLPAGTRIALEHGGAAPVILDKSADLQAAVAPIVKGGFYHAGQVCVSVQRVYVHDSMLSEFSAALVEKVKALRVGDPKNPITQVGPLIRPREVDRVAAWVDEAVHAGAVLGCGGVKLSETTYAPTVLINPPRDSRVSTREIFGPVVCIYSYREIDEAIAAANSLPWAFQAAVFTRDIEIAMHVAQRLNATAVMVNESTAFRTDWMPFGGRDASGLGLGGIPHSAEEMSRPKLVVLRSDRQVSA